MERFDEREKKILEFLSKHDTPVTGKSLSMALGMSLRTVQSAVAEINRSSPLIRSSNKGYSIIRENAANIHGETLYRPGNEHEILKKMIFADKALHIDEFAEELYMSTATLEKKLRSFDIVLEKYGLKVTRKNMYIRIEGSEYSKRKLIKHLIFDEIDPAFHSIDNLSAYFPGMDIQKIKEILSDSLRLYQYYTDDVYSASLILNIVIALYRMKSDYSIKDTDQCITDKECVEYLIAREICRRYSLNWKLLASDAEVGYIAALLSGQIKPLNADSARKPPEVISPAFLKEISGILTEVFDYYMLSINYSEYLHSFAMHIEGMVKRARAGHPAVNELLFSIKKNCPFIHDVAVQIAGRIGEKYQIDISDSEIGYISIHIGYLIEHTAESSEKISVLLLCTDYHHMAKLIKDRLDQDFGRFVEVKIEQQPERENVLTSDADLIITTLPLHIIGRRAEMISPFYTADDDMKIDRAVRQCINEKKKTYRNQLLSAFFREDLFFKTDILETKEDVICFLGQKIIDCKIAEDGFIRSVLKRENMSSTCFFNTFAIPHAIDLNAKRTVFCVLISEKGIQWDTHKIHIVLMIAVHQKDRREFMKIYNGIVRSLEDQEKVWDLVRCDTYLEFMDRIRSGT